MLVLSHSHSLLSSLDIFATLLIIPLKNLAISFGKKMKVHSIKWDSYNIVDIGSLSLGRKKCC